MNIEEQNESGTEMIDAMFEKYLIRYINIHFKQYHNSYQVGEWFIMDILEKFMRTRVTDKKRSLTAIRLLLKDKNVDSLMKELKSNENLS